jgi:penicillin-binding protein 2
MQQRDELDLLKRRINIVGYTIVLLLGVLTAGFWHAQIVESAHYIELADKNRIKNIPLIAPRGQILDRYGRVLADNRPSYDSYSRRQSAYRGRNHGNARGRDRYPRRRAFKAHRPEAK